MSQGNLLAIRDRYETRAIANLNDKELAILCDIYIKHMSITQALGCLDALQSRPGKGVVSEQIAGKRGLLAYLVGHFRRSATLTSKLQEDGGRYVHALAQARLGNRDFAAETARLWVKAYDPEHVFLGANLYLAIGQYENALRAVLDPERRLVRDYSLSGGRDVFGKQIAPAPLKIDLFDEFGFGLLDTYSYAPAANVYVEFILAKSELELGSVEKARHHLDRILSYENIGAYREVQWRALYERARIAEIGNATNEAIDLYRQAIDIIESVRSSISTEAGRIGFVGDKQDVYADLIQLLIAQGEVGTAFEYTERARSRALVDLLASQQQFGARSIPQVEADGLLRDYERAESRVLEGQGMATPTETTTRSGELNKIRRVLSKAPMLSGLVTVDSTKARLETIQSHIAQGETVLSYFNAQDKWYAFVLSRSNPAPYYWELDLPKLTEDIEHFRKAMRTGGGSEYRLAAQRLYDRLIRPVEGRFSTTLTIVPYGDLHYLPFAALHSGQHFLIEKHSVRTIPSAEVISVLTPAERPHGRMLAFGNPYRGQQELELPGAAAEATKVAELLRPSKLLLGRDASRANFFNLGPQYDIVHLATHGEFDPLYPRQSRLLLATSVKDSGDLTVEDLFAMRTPLRASIAVLSACETTLASVSNGDELIGLQRGFLYAGANSIIGSQWRIADEETTVYLMEEFYSALDSGVSRAEALRQAQLKTLERYPDRGDWAAFTYVGSAG